MLAGNEMDRSVSRPPAGGGGDGLYNQRHTDSKKLERNPTMAAAATALPSRLLPRMAGVSLEAKPILTIAHMSIYGNNH